MSRVFDRLESWGDRILDLAFDLRYGVETRGIVEPDQLELSREDLQTSKRYQGSHVRELRRALRKAEIDLADYHFVDLGSGKGRALFIASRFPFRSYTGIELSPPLLALAKKNAEAFCSKTKTDPGRFEWIQANALDYQPTTSPNLFYLFNPFKLEVVTQVLNNLKTSPTAGHDVILTMNPQSDSLLDQADYACIQELYHHNLNKTVRFYRQRPGQDSSGHSKS